MGTVGDTRIVALEVKLEDRHKTTLSESRCQVCPVSQRAGLSRVPARVPHTKWPVMRIYSLSQSSQPHRAVVYRRHFANGALANHFTPSILTACE
jgi:hypothetical protein